MPTFKDCAISLAKVHKQFGNEGSDDLRSRYGVKDLGELWVGMYLSFCEFARACLECDVPPGASWRGNGADEPFVPSIGR